MGICPSKDPQTVRNKKIQKEIDAAREKDRQKLKLLLLGAGESGKSTLFKQMKILYTEQFGFTDKEKEEYKKAVFNNIISETQILIRATETHTELQTEAGISAAHKVVALDKKKAFVTPDLVDVLEVVWNDPGTQETWENRGDIQVQDALEYFMKRQNLLRISAPEYLPSNMDILRTRVRTIGIAHEPFIVDGAHLELYDVGGQRNERSKWINAFDGVTGVIFVAAISEYNQVLFEDTSANRQAESLNLFKEQISRENWKDTPFILFLNKTDLFREKLAKVPFRVASGPDARNVDFNGPYCDPGRDYITDGSDDDFEKCYDAACNYIQGMYESLNQNMDRDSHLFIKFTNSTDTQNIEHIMNSCKQIILRGNLRKGGWLE